MAETQEPMGNEDEVPEAARTGTEPAKAASPEEEPVKAAPAHEATDAPAHAAAENGGIGLLYDIELDATLQFGSKEMLLRDVLELGPGDVVELDRHIAEPVDLVVGDRIVARGEVVVVGGSFALHGSEVLEPQPRLESGRGLL